MLVLGIMSGTSIDGVDYALCEVTDRSIRLVRLWSRSFPRAMRSRLHAAAAGECGSHELGQLHHDLGRLYARQAAGLTSGAELVGLHGQTVFHNPSKSTRATLQIGEPAYLAERLRLPVVSNFRAADIAAGGHGAPLATLFHQTVFGRRGCHVCVNNLGGISNVTSIDWRNECKVMAFDTGPANVLIDLAMRHFTRERLPCDRDGKWARRGTVNETILNRWLAHPYFYKKPPKSSGRELFGEPFWRAAKRGCAKAGLTEFDTVATLSELTARSMCLNYKLHLPDMPAEIVLCGGGARNPHLVERIRDRFPAVKVVLSSERGWPVEAVEPAAFALLAYRTLHKQPGNLPATTGATRMKVLGQITLG